jgi:hypothetical protein
MHDYDLYTRPTNRWCVQAQLERTENGWTCSKQVPTFYLDGNVQGFSTFVGAGAIARQILNPTNDPNLTVHISVERV